MSFGVCPQCSQRMRVEKLHCWQCGTSVSGHLAVPVLARLPSEAAEFVHRFVLANGSLSAVQKQIGCSYPKVRRLLNDAMAALRTELEVDQREKQSILEALEDRSIDGKDAAKLILAMGPAPTTPHLDSAPNGKEES